MDIAALFSGTPNEVLVAALAFSRVVGLFTAAPVFRARNMPNMVVAGLALLVVLLLLPGLGAVAIPLGPIALLLLVLREVGLGLVLGTIVQLLFDSVQTAGKFIDTEMGFQMASQFDPLSGEQTPLIGNLLGMLSLMFYLAMNGHILLLRALGESFKLVPLGSSGFSFAPDLLVQAFIGMFALAVQMALPIIGVSLATSFMFGLMAKVVPQMNVFVVGMPIKVVVLSSLFVMIMPMFMYFLEYSLGEIFLKLANWLAAGVG